VFQMEGTALDEVLASHHAMLDEVLASHHAMPDHTRMENLT